MAFIWGDSQHSPKTSKELTTVKNTQPMNLVRFFRRMLLSVIASGKIFTQKHSVARIISTRTLPKRFFYAQARDTDLQTDDRPGALSFLEFDSSANTTLCFDGVEALPGSASGSKSSGFKTTYDRIGSVSPMGIVGFPIYFHVAAAGLPRYDLGTSLLLKPDFSMLLLHISRPTMKVKPTRLHPSFAQKGNMDMIPDAVRGMVRERTPT